MTSVNTYPHIPDVLEEHAEECAFVWQQRDDALFAPDFDLPDLREWDNLLHAHVEGLLIGKDVALEQAMALEGDFRGEWFVQARLLIARGETSAFIDLLAASSPEPEFAKAVRSALGFAEPNELKGLVQHLLASEEKNAQLAGIAGCALHRVDPGPVLKSAISSADTVLAARALKCAGELGLKAYGPDVEARLSDTSSAVRFSAARAATLLGLSTGLPVLKDVSVKDGSHQREAMMLYTAVAEPEEVSAWLAQLANTEATARLAMVGAGLTGDPKYLPALLDRMHIRELARVAGEAFEWITGLYIYEASLEVIPEVEVPSPEVSMDWFEENEVADDDESIHPEDLNLVVPDIEKMARWWDANKHRFETNTRYFCGMPAGPEADTQLLRVGRQRYRHQAAISLALRSPSAQLFDVRAPARRQWRALAANS